MRLLGLDVGDKRIGISLSDEMGWTAQPLMTLHRTGLEKDLKILEDIIQKHGVSKIVAGVPRSLSLKITPQTQKVLDFITILKSRITLPIEEWDEWFTTKSAERVLIEADVSRKKRKKSIDQLAAVLILQGYLDSHR
ncbi:MAG: Holliday junction DNA helicase RuvA [Deltaproteobacteria bacterium GWA2_38_16]|nr:MAG: Holliday junction DNA helicase RuvA [Deltaproteobacteria bacterium GWA2_38_16]OGQ03392.1 MAG: Holliday junction DNA helicase RuvA [Deltaproteobacteria bacterium RIFCSPHIGHO2_02_FULL_38_15]OGQ34725.1 MAG: Holliday junction DNA helicase RuvA [Deltaproteobacteria bacterium RIFCSPLOWO2_01_FULL_38_9]OGQ59682.1 MAG: Holliday junction DNA helicase RuvA [Deltaproteobacteria bacterium RIFCSPLOWO2_12_FULL_38_8]HBQ20669.1 Holliday junction resolvase RuvX [Deltaproteobacteria bacterium]